MNEIESPPLLLRPNPISGKDFCNFSKFIYDKVGIKLPLSKKTMVEARLRKRLKSLGFTEYDTYFEYLYSNQGQEKELISLIDVITTNTTGFFREPKHFELLSNSILPEWMSGRMKNKSLDIWSAGCSTGMEPYTLAMVFSEFSISQPQFRWSILATDVSSQVLEAAKNGVYEEHWIKNMPLHLVKKYFRPEEDTNKSMLRVSPEIKKSIIFKRLNFMEDFSVPKPLSIIFCRNVVIYFDKPTQKRLFTKLCDCLTPGGYLFIGHAESLFGMDLPLKQVFPTVFKRI